MNTKREWTITNHRRAYNHNFPIKSPMNTLHKVYKVSYSKGGFFKFEGGRRVVGGSEGYRWGGYHKVLAYATGDVSFILFELRNTHDLQSI